MWAALLQKNFRVKKINAFVCLSLVLANSLGNSQKAGCLTLLYLLIVRLTYLVLTPSDCTKPAPTFWRFIMTGR